MMTFDEALTLLDTPAAKRFGRRKLANNTYLHRREDGRIGIQLHDTDVVILSPEYAELQSGGWYTMVTKDRMSLFAPVNIGSRQGAWYVMPDYLAIANGKGTDPSPSYPRVDYTREDWQEYQDSEEHRALVDQYEADYDAWTERRKAWEAEHPPVAYFDGIRITYAGEVLNALPTEDEKARMAEREAMKKRIAKYVKLVKAGLPALPDPSGGDCWYCALHETTTGKALGDASQDHSHLLEHMEEGYVVPSLIWNAVAESGYNPAYTWRMDFIATRAVRKYLTKRLVDTPAGYSPAGATTDRALSGFTIRSVRSSR